MSLDIVSTRERSSLALVSDTRGSRLGIVSVSSRTVWQMSRSRLGLGSSGLGLAHGLGLDPEGLGPIPATWAQF